jgi:glucan phosphoethanolaminetransferase (alkaline phosphatase superfamily)
MNGAYLHILLNHFPIMSLLFGIIFLIISSLTANKNARIFALYLFAGAGLMTLATFLTGEPAEDIVERLPNVSRYFIHEHEEFAEKAVWLIYVTALFSLWQIFFLRSHKGLKELAAWRIKLLYLISFLSLAAIGWTNKLGGKVSHPEFRSEEDNNRSAEFKNQ